MTELPHQKTAWGLIEQIAFCMLVTHESDNCRLRSRPMSTHIKLGDDAIYFLIDADSRIEDDISADNNVCLAFAGPESQKYVSITGAAEILSDGDEFAELWSVAERAWWDTRNDANVRVIRVVPTDIEYWEGNAHGTHTEKLAASLNRTAVSGQNHLASEGHAQQ